MCTKSKIHCSSYIVGTRLYTSVSVNHWPRVACYWITPSHQWLMGKIKLPETQKSIKWHDLALDEYAGAAAQVHSVVFAQLGTLSREFLLLIHVYFICLSTHTLYPDSGCISNYLSLTHYSFEDSMIELGCGVPRACNFVRRLSIRYQLPLSLRITLIQHLTKKRNWWSLILWYNINIY